MPPADGGSEKAEKKIFLYLYSCAGDWSVRCDAGEWRECRWSSVDGGESSVYEAGRNIERAGWWMGEW